MNNNIFKLLQFAGSTFPNGAFSHSWGLETYVFEKKINNSDEFSLFLDMYIRNILGKCDAPFVPMSAREKDNIEVISELNSISLAMKMTAESKVASTKPGNAMFRIAMELIKDDNFKKFYDMNKEKGISQGIAYGMIMSYFDISLYDMTASFIFNSIEALVQCGVKLIPIGNSEAQKLLFSKSFTMDEVAKNILNMGLEDLSNFNPALEIASMKHEKLPIRLYIS